MACLSFMVLQITVPNADLDALSFCDPDTTALSDWLDSLPMANTEETATQIRQATFEIARLAIDFRLRMELLESLRPSLHYLCARLDRAATSGDHGDSIARTAQRLQTNLSSGYKAVILAALGEADDRNVTDIVSLAIYRAISDLSRTLLRTLQFYVAPADRMWLELNQLYLLAEELGVQDERWEDTENNANTETSSKDAYLRAILLALSKPNQLRHRQLSHLFNALEVWTPTVSLGAAEDDSLYSIDLVSDQGPRHSELLLDASEIRCIGTEVLVFEMEAYLNNIDGKFSIPDQIDNSLASHLTNSWGAMQQRAHHRAAVTGAMKVCVGLRAVHYFLSGGVEFSDQFDETDSALRMEVNPFINPDIQFYTDGAVSKDVWDDAFDLSVRIPFNPKIDDPEERLLGVPDGKKKRPPKDKQKGYICYDTTTLDTSPGGYRIRWNGPLPASVQTGELVAMREPSDPRWYVSVVRWIRQEVEGTFMGVELIAPRAIPVAARVVNKRGGPSEYARALLLPELLPIGQLASLLTPPLPFKAGQKIHLSRQGIQTTAQLNQCLLKTESVNQFTFRMLDGYLENTQINITMTNTENTLNDHESGESR